MLRAPPSGRAARPARGGRSSRRSSPQSRRRRRRTARQHRRRRRRSSWWADPPRRWGRAPRRGGRTQPLPRRGGRTQPLPRRSRRRPPTRRARRLRTRCGSSVERSQHDAHQVPRVYARVVAALVLRARARTEHHRVPRHPRFRRRREPQAREQRMHVRRAPRQDVGVPQRRAGAH